MDVQRHALVEQGQGNAEELASEQLSEGSRRTRQLPQLGATLDVRGDPSLLDKVDPKSPAGSIYR